MVELAAVGNQPLVEVGVGGEVIGAFGGGADGYIIGDRGYGGMGGEVEEMTGSVAELGQIRRSDSIRNLTCGLVSGSAAVRSTRPVETTCMRATPSAPVLADTMKTSLAAS